MLLLFFVLDDLLADANVDIEADADQNGMRMKARFFGGHRRTGGASVWRWASGASWAMMRWASDRWRASGSGWAGRTSWTRWTFGTLIRMMMMIMGRTRRTSWRTMRMAIVTSGNIGRSAFGFIKRFIHCWNFINDLSGTSSRLLLIHFNI
jgi:hypothetical protein